MFSTSLVLLSDQTSLMRSVDVIANNIANSSTTGFKRESVQFDSYMGKGAAKGPSYVYDRATYRDTSPGTITSTGNPLDLAIQGQGYFEIQTPGGTQYTRNGAFRTNDQGQITTSSGLPVLTDAGQPLALPEDSSDVTISGDGYVTAQVGTSASRAQLGKIGVVKFDNDQAVTPVGNGLSTTNQAPTPVIGNAIMQGAIEDSNVKPVVEMTELIRIQRAYEQASSMSSDDNTRLSDAIDKLSQIS